MNKIEVFNKEYTYIKNPDLINDVKYLINNLPDYFFHIASASTNKYHPQYANGEGGLVRHTKSAVRIAHELLENVLIGNKYTAREKDLMIIALLIHDGLKSGRTENRWHKTEHPLYMVEFINEHKNNLSMTEEDVLFLSKAVASHMGPWNKDFQGNEVLPIPQSKYESFVHMCDYISSRKFLKVDFDDDNNIID